MSLRKRWALGLLLSLAAGPAAATEFIVCNEGKVPVYAATAARESEFFVSHVWRVSGWYEIRKGACSRLYDSDDPFYFAFSFKDSRGEWGAARFKPDRDDMWQVPDENLCVARDEFEYTRGGSDPVGPCKDGYFRFPGTLVFYPNSDYATFRLDVDLGEGDRAYPVDLQPLEASKPDGSHRGAPAPGDELPSNQEPTFMDELVKTVLDAAGEGLKEGVENAVEQALTRPNPTTPSPPPQPAASPSPPEPPADRALNAKLFGAEIMRRSYSGSPWLNTDGSSVEVFYELDGASSSDLFDAPTQRTADDPEVGAALATLNRALASIAGNRDARVTSEGRLKYDFEAQGGALSRHWVNLEALDFARARVISDRTGFTGFAVPCNYDRRCVIAVDQDAAGNQSNHEIRNELEIFFATEQDGLEVWAALQQLRRLYPAEPVVTVR